MIGWLFGFRPWHLKLTDLITAGCGGCFICNCFARDSLKTSSKHLAITKVWGEIKQHLIAKMFWNRTNQETVTSSLRQKQWAVKCFGTKEPGAINEFREKKNCKSIINACDVLVSVCDCHQLGHAQGSWAVVHSEIWHPLRIKRQVLFSVGDKYKFTEGWGATDVYFLHCKLASLEMNAGYFGHHIYFMPNWNKSREGSINSGNKKMKASTSPFRSRLKLMNWQE